MKCGAQGAVVGPWGPLWGPGGRCGALGAVALTVGSVPRRVVPELRHFNWLLKINNQSN